MRPAACARTWPIGQPVLISDHLNLTARSPLVGAQFVDMTDAYAPRLRELARSIDPELTEGVYAALPGPHYETPAEIRMLRMLGADLVGMSTVHETIAARAAGAEVLGVSLVTNLAAGITGEPLSHADVLAAGAASAARIGSLLAEIISPSAHVKPEDWIAHDPDPQTAAELAACGADELAARFARPLTFGTAGLRGRGARRAGRDESRGGVACHLGSGTGARRSRPGRFAGDRRARRPARVGGLRHRDR